MKKWMFLIALLAGTLLLSACATDSADCSDLPASGPRVKITGAWTWAAASGNTAAYLVISNCGSEAEKLLSVKSNAAALAELHITTMSGDMASMNAVTQIEIPAGKKVELKSGSYHVMLMQIKQEIKAGDLVDLTLVFNTAGAIPITAPARAP